MAFHTNGKYAKKVFFIEFFPVLIMRSKIKL